MRTTIVRGLAYFSYTPLLALAAVITFGKLIVYAGLIDVEGFGSLGKMLLVSTVFGMVGHLGLQSVASRDLPALLARGRERRALRLLWQTAAVTTWVAICCLVAVSAGMSLFGLTTPEVALGIVHGWSQSVFLTASYESRSRLQMFRYSRDTAARSIAAAVAGVAAGASGGGPDGILLAEIALTLALLAAVAAMAIKRARSSGALPVKLARGFSSLPWRSAALLLAGAFVAFTSTNFDRWIAAEQLGRESFGQYAFAWMVLLAAQSAQALLNSGLLPLIARRRASALEASAYRLTLLAASMLLAAGLLLAGPLTWLIVVAIERLLPQYGDATPLLVPLLLAAVLRVSDFWSSFLIVVEREGLVLAGQSAALVVVVAGFLAWLAVEERLPTPLSLAWFAFVAALLSHVASGVGVLALRITQRRVESNSS